MGSFFGFVSFVFILAVAIASVVIVLRVVSQNFENNSDNLSRVPVRSYGSGNSGVVHRESSSIYNSRNCDL